MLEVVNTHRRRNAVTRVGVMFDGAYPKVSGGREYFMARYGLSKEKIVAAIKAAKECPEPQ